MPDQTPPPRGQTASRVAPVPRQEERLEYRFALAFGFMSVIPILIVWAWARVHAVDMSLAIYGIVGSALIGYFFITRRMVRSMLAVTRKVKAITSGQAAGRIDVTEPNEIGELARSFNRITQELEHKIEELESSRELARKLLTRIGTAINSYEGIDNLLNLIIENSAAALGAEMGTLMLVDGEKQELYVKTTWSNNGQVADPQLRIKLGDGVAGWVARENRPMRATAQPAALGFGKTGSAESAVLSVPLQLRDHPIGVLTVLRRGSTSGFTEDDEILLGSIGSQVAVAIENYRLNLDVERTYLETIMALALAVEAKDPYSAGHSKRVGFYATQIAEEMGLGEEMLRTLNDAGILHDIGKIGIKDEILLKPGALTPDEQKIMQQHPVIGEAIVKPVRSLGKVVALVRHHHERYDGAGYPAGLRGEAIPLGARILAVADTYDAMVTDRPYRKRLSVEDTKRELKKGAGSQHDPAVVDALLRVLERKELRLAAAKAAATPAQPFPVSSPAAPLSSRGSDPAETLGCR
ncbi:MAG: HD domain-containing protein [Candidatus Omnitrophica bacterium]|nr:HD domain-containing protein [Candidatus Omnitrophota bacterium]